MASLLKISSGSILAVIFCLIHSWSLAQNEVARERSSLQGIQSMGFTVNLESSASLTQKSDIKVASLQKLGETALQDKGITLIRDDEVERSDEIPFLYLHVNAMDTPRGLVPFSISLYFYQPVKLTLNRDMKTSSVTWESGSLGIVSYDQMDLINDAARDLLKEFIADYNAINSN